MVRIDGVLPYEPSDNSAVRYPIVVQGNGTIALPSIEPIVVRGKSVEQTIGLIKKAYLEAKIFTTPAMLIPLVTVGVRRGGSTQKLSLEVGMLGNEFRLVNYVTQGEQNLPKTLVPSLSIRGNTESQADGTYLLTNLITNPGSLLSAHLANEEIRQRDLENKKKTKDVVQLKNEENGHVQGRIAEVSNKGDVVWINLGKADGLRRGVIFNVLNSEDGTMAVARPKAKIEVVELVGEKLSRCKVVTNNDSRSIQRGDSIYSPVWQPGQRAEFALVGKMDLDGDGRDDRDKLKALIEDNGGLVTFDLPPTGKATGELTVDTRWLVLGEDAKLLEDWRNLELRSKNLGISMIPLDKLLGFLKHRK